MTFVLSQLDQVATPCMNAITRASVLGCIAMAVAWSISYLFPQMPSRARNWIWRIAYLKFLIALVWASPIELPLLPADAPIAEAEAAIAPGFVRTDKGASAAESNVLGERASGPERFDGLSPRSALSLRAALFLTWSAGVAVASLVLIRNLAVAYALRSRAKPMDDPIVTEVAAELLRCVGVTRGPRLLASESPIIPQLVGICRPAIILPVTSSATYSASEMRLIVAHEIAHWQRRDLWWNWLPAAVHTLFFFHPAVWIAHYEWRFAQETACDGAAIGLTQATPTDYGRMILKVIATCREAASTSSFSVGVSNSYHTLNRRISAMNAAFLRSQAIPRSLAIALVVGAAVGLVPWRLANSEESGTQQALNGYSTYLCSIRSASFTSIFKDQIKEESDTFTNSLAQDWSVDFERHLMWRQTKKVSIGDSIVPANFAVSEQLKSPGRFYEVSQEPDSGNIVAMTGYLEVPKDYWTTKTGFLYMSAPFGFLDDKPMKSIPALLIEPSVAIQGDSIVLTGGVVGEYEIKMQLSRSKGWMAERIDFVRTAIPGRPQVVKSSYIVDESKEFDGIWFPIAYHCTIESSAGSEKLPSGVRIKNGVVTMQLDKDGKPSGSSFTNRPAATLIAEVTLQNVVLNKATDKDFNLRADVPNGTRVWLQDAINLDYMWLDGKAVPR
ncbi:MAG: M56 family metallopeptidase [Planctomycetales bacterium]|nr:M56 family metallopeptidase [Planctomycetales bacterium]